MDDILGLHQSLLALIIFHPKFSLYAYVRRFGFCYNLCVMYVEIHLGDIVRLRKKHPCGSFEWKVVRLGTDIGLVCLGCERKIMLPRGEFNKRLKTIVHSDADEV